MQVQVVSDYTNCDQCGGTERYEMLRLELGIPDKFFDLCPTHWPPFRRLLMQALLKAEI